MTVPSSMFTTSHPFTRAYHLTDRKHLDSIMRLGLELDRSDDYYGTSIDAADYYGFVPVYAAVDGPWESEHGHADPVLLQLDITDLPIAIDVPCLGDEGAVYTFNRLSLEMCSQDVANALFGEMSPMAAASELTPDDVSYPSVIEAGCRRTETMAIGAPVEPSRITMAPDGLQLACITFQCDYWDERLRRRLN